MELKNLKKKIPYKWRVQSFSKNKPIAQCVAYIDARDVMDLLDEVCGEENWQSDFKEVKGNIYAGIGIFINNNWVWKWDCGVESNVDKEKGEASDSFKRAAVKWGVGRFLYELEIKYAKASEIKNQSNYPYVIDDFGRRIYNLTEYINNIDNSSADRQNLSKFSTSKPISSQNAINVLRAKISKLGAQNDEEAVKTVLDRSGIVIKTMKDLDEETAKLILTFFNN